VVPRASLKGCREQNFSFPTGVQTPDHSVCNETLPTTLSRSPVCGKSKCEVLLVQVVSAHVESGSEVPYTFLSSALDGSKW
jgi:hypothetical protein